MSLLTTIDGIPLFSTVEEALEWGQTLGATGFHTHDYQGEVGYMAGNDHSDLALAITTPTMTPQTPTVTIPTPVTPTVTPTPSTNSGGGY